MFCRICLLVVVLLFTGGQTQVCNRCPTGFTHFPKENKCYKVIPAKVIWDVAFSMCYQLGAHLPVVKNADANTALRAAATPFLEKCKEPHGISYFWTSGRFPCKSCPFKWITGSGNLLDIGYTNWKKNEPNNSDGDEECIELAIGAEYGWNDETCINTDCVICEIDL